MRLRTVSRNDVRLVPTVRDEQLAAQRHARSYQFSPLAGDGPLAKAKLLEITAFLDGVGDQEECSDKFRRLRAELQEARYRDWKNAKTGTEGNGNNTTTAGAVEA